MDIFIVNINMSLYDVNDEQLKIYEEIKRAFERCEYEPKILIESSENMVDVEDESVQLIVTSPPYNVGIEYGAYDDSKDKEEYLGYLDGIWAECKRVLCRGGRIAVNVANTNRNPFNFMAADIATRLRDRHGFQMRGDIIWDKGASVGVSTAWGSWRSASNPTLRDVHEHILVFSKDDWRLHSKNRRTTISSEEFCASTQSIWKIRTTNGKSKYHPTMFPLELPKRLIQLYTYVGDTVLDPFLGSGTTCVAAKGLARKSIGYEIDPQYKEIIKQRIFSVTELGLNPQDIKTKGKFLEERMGPII